jgi:signal transduction histidine kinase
MHPENAPRQLSFHLDADARLRAILADLQVGVVIAGPDAALWLSNQAALDLLGLTENQLRGEAPLDPSWSVVHEDGSPFPAATQPLAVALATHLPVRNVVMGVYHPDRRERVWLLATADPQLGPEGVVTQVVLTYSDLTDRRGFEARLAVTDRLAAMGTLASGIAHEINNPLAYITANLAYLEEELADPKTFTDPARLTEVRHAIHEARDGAERVRNIVTDMRALARGDRMHRPIDVTLVLKSAVAALSGEIRARARLTTRFVPVPLIKGNEARLGQVFIGLLLNAYEAITTGTPEDHEITIATSVDGQHRVVIEVHDTGIGIPPQLHERIFDPFFSANPRGKGKGLGLAICHHIITDLGGTISVESAPARGSVFRVALPSVTEGVEATGATTITSATTTTTTAPAATMTSTTIVTTAPGGGGDEGASSADRPGTAAPSSPVATEGAPPASETTPVPR